MHSLLGLFLDCMWWSCMAREVPIGYTGKKISEIVVTVV